MDDFNAELLSSQEERHEVDRILRGATDEYQVGRITQLNEDIDKYAHRGIEDRYILHGVFARLIAVHTEVDDAWDDHEIAAMYDTVVHELINTLTSYLSQG